MTKNNITTIEGLAALIHETMASKEDIKDVREDIATVNGRLDRIEHLLIEEQRRKIENLETRMKKLEDALAIYSHTKKAAREWRLLVGFVVLFPTVESFESASMTDCTSCLCIHTSTSRLVPK